MKKRMIISTVATIGILALPALASAHVIVTPGQAGVAQELVFNVSVPNERSVAVTSVQLDIPKGVDEVTPTVTPGWMITTAGGNDVTTITWTGAIPVGQREDFSFGAQAPASATQPDWKAYQTCCRWYRRTLGSEASWQRRRDR